MATSPSDEELAAITAAYAVLMKPVVVVTADDAGGPPNAWRFSGRWWTRPVASRRVRP